MELLIHLCGFAGGWLLVAGPVFQAAVELREEDYNREEMMAVADRMTPAKPVSPWWWLLPPVHWLLSRHRRDEFRKAVFAALTQAQREQMVGFANKATGWMAVAGGAALIAVKETWELTHLLHLHDAVFWVAIVVMAGIAVGHTVVRMRGSKQMIETGVVP